MTALRLLPHLSAAAKVNLANKLLGISGSGLFISSIMFVSILLFIVFPESSNMANGDQTSGSVFNRHPLVVGVLAVFTLLTLVSGGYAFWISRKRRFSSGILHSESFDAIADELHGRGIRNTSKYLREHPRHLEQFFVISQEMQYPEYTKDVPDTLGIRTLLFMRDSDPLETRNMILDIILDRGITKPDEIRGLMQVSQGVSTPLLSGIL